MQDENAQFLFTIRQLKGNAVLLRFTSAQSTEVAFVSEEFAAMCRCAPPLAYERMREEGLLAFVDAQDQRVVRNMLGQHASREGGSTIVVRMVTAQGDKLWCDVRFSFVDSFNDRFVYCTFTNITQLKELEGRLKNTYETLCESFYHIGENTLSLVRANLTLDRIEEVRGRDAYDSDYATYSFEEASRQRASHMPISGERTEFEGRFGREALLAAYAQGRTSVSLITYTERRNGTFCYAEAIASMTRHPLTGDVIAFISEKECNDDKVRQTLTRSALARHFDMVCYLVNGTYGVTIGQTAYGSRGSIFPKAPHGSYEGYLEEQVFPVLSGTPDEREQMARSLELASIEEALLRRDAYVVNIKIEQDGEEFYKRLDFYRVDPEARFYILLKSDTTEIQRRHLALIEQLRIALDAANQASVAKTSFLSSMSHEIRTPMNAIIGLDKIALSEEGLSDRTRDHLEKIGTSARHLLGLINDILDMSRIESGRMTLANDTFSFAGMLEEITTIIGGQCRDKGLVFECHVAPEVSDYYVGDVLKLKQVLINILGNSVKFTEVGGTVGLKVKVAGTREDSTSLRFELCDTGIGMDESFLPHIFDAFSQESTSRSSVYGSTGLGMAITKSIVEMMQGEISVESQKGVGTTFTVDVVLRNGEQHVREEQQEVDLSCLEGARVLLAEDIAINAEIMTEVLDMEGILVDHAENGLVALRMFEDSPAGHYDAVLMDMRMPVMDGLTAAKRIRACGHPDATNVPIIALTANAFDEDVRKSLRAGLNAHLSKPVDADELYRALAELMAKRGK